METPVDARLIEEARTYRLRFACPDCVHFEPESQSCSNGYPSEPHRDASLVPNSIVMFCKSFELL